jgi:hypothetical protein
MVIAVEIVAGSEVAAVAGSPWRAITRHLHLRFAAGTVLRLRAPPPGSGELLAPQSLGKARACVSVASVRTSSGLCAYCTTGVCGVVLRAARVPF